MRKFLLFTITSVILTVACQNEALDKPLCTDDSDIYASIDDDFSSKTMMDANNKVLWSKNDQIILFRKSILGAKYQVQGAYVGETYACFSKLNDGDFQDNFGTAVALDYNIAYYPYSKNISCKKVGVDYALEVELPKSQNYVLESFDNQLFPMVAISEDNDLRFKNVCGAIKLQFKGTQQIASITIEGNDHEKLSGEAVVTAYSNAAKPTITMKDNASETVTLDCGSGVRLSENKSTEFIIVIPPTKFSRGFKVHLKDTKGNLQTIEATGYNEVKRSWILNMPEVTLEEFETQSQCGMVNNLYLEVQHAVGLYEKLQVNHVYDANDRISAVKYSLTTVEDNQSYLEECVHAFDYDTNGKIYISANGDFGNWSSESHLNELNQVTSFTETYRREYHEYSNNVYLEYDTNGYISKAKFGDENEMTFIFNYDNGMWTSFAQAFENETEVYTEKMIPDSYHLELYSNNNINIDLNVYTSTLWMNVDTYSTLASVKYIGRIGDYLCEVLPFPENYDRSKAHVPFQDYTDDKYFHQSSSYEECEMLEIYNPIEYEFNDLGYPVLFECIIPMFKRQINVDLVAGEYDDGMRLYRVVETNKTITDIGTVYTTIKRSVTYR